MAWRDRLPAGLVLGGALAVAALMACGAEDFEPVSKVQSVRVLAARVDKPYARPGDTVTMDLLTYDGRREQPLPMRTYWLPVVCVNPTNDAYYACFQQLLGGGGDGGVAPIVVLPGSQGGDGGAPEAGVGVGGAGAGGGAGAAALAAILRPGVDLGPYLHEGNQFTFTLPQDIIQTHPPVPGFPTPYGIAIAFNITCAGRVQLVERSASETGPLYMPLGCFDDQGNKLGADDFVLGFSRVYAYDTQTNTNPVVSGVTWEGAPVNLATGVVVDHCTTEKVEDCPKKKVAVLVTPESQEARPGESSDNLNERLYATYYVTDGKLGSEVRILYEINQGAVPDSYNEFQAPKAVGLQHMWIIARDNRGGATWVDFNVDVR